VLSRWTYDAMPNADGSGVAPTGETWVAHGITAPPLIWRRG